MGFLGFLLFLIVQGVIGLKRVCRVCRVYTVKRVYRGLQVAHGHKKLLNLSTHEKSSKMTEESFATRGHAEKGNPESMSSSPTNKYDVCGHFPKRRGYPF